MFYLLVLCLSGIATSAQYLTIKGRITDADTMMILFRSMNRCDTVFTSNGNFTFTRKLSSPELFTIACVKGQQSILAAKEGNERNMRSREDGVYSELFLESGETVLHTSFAGFKNAKPLSAKHTAQDKYNEFRKRFDPLVKVARTVIDSSYAKRTDQEKKIFTMLYDKINQVETEVAEKFAIENCTNVVGAYVLYRYGRTEDHHKLDSLYRLFDPALQATAYLKNIKEKIKSLAALKPGQPVPVFNARSFNDKMVSIADLKGKYVVLDFWGSWCMPCISGFPKMKEYYSKYKDRIEFIGIACRDKKTEWINAIKKYDLNWIQIFNNEGVDDIGVKYNVEAYPTKILIDANGKFIQSFIGESAAFYQKLDEILEAGNK